MSSQPDALPFTGERFTPECVREIWYEHFHRYAFARRLAAGKRVLDAACGEGYGSALLAEVAAEVTGVDIDAASVAHARARYAGKPNLRYERADAARLPFADRTFDLVVSFETLEHLAAQQELLAGFARVLADDGVLVISSPDKRTYSELAGFRNEFHVRELYREELLDLLRPHFGAVRLYGQKLLFQSALWALDREPASCEVRTAAAGGAQLAAGPDYAPLYFIAVCARHALPAALPDLSLFGDREESVYAHYNHEIRKNMSAGARIAQLEAELERLRRATQASPARRDWRWWRRNRSTE
ncbi:MAG: class I SAM-dependent methyltransferase [Rhodanobacteraceae bacterium]|jgi:SAM-dependent methyltransferase|nr:class I SAM-dependent methyltransferase [Rhodanobacteraceae bacterium]